MSDVKRDLYSFLRSKDVLSSDSDRDADDSDAEPDASTESTDDASPENEAARPKASDASPAEAEPSPREPAAMPDFEADNIGERLHALGTEALNALDFGVVRLDDEGVVQFYNEYESELSGVNPDDAVGRNFFTSLAPCSNNRIFLGRFRKGVQSGDLDERFTYTFTYKMRPTLVDIRLYRDDEGTNWLLVKKR
jgi:photoactive yellow protein